jgi:photosystem II stability/assembly factor-like uncharacterized protein
MKKSLLTIFTAVLSLSAFAQPSPSWTMQNSNFPNVSAGIRYMDAVDPNVVWAIGYDGTGPNRASNYFTRTINGGTNWNPGFIWPDTNSYIPSSIQGIDANTAWVAAYAKPSQSKGAVFKTTDGGSTWLNMNAVGMFTNAAAFCNLVAFTSPSLGIAMGDPVGGDFEIWRTTDGGGNWTKVPAANIPNPLSSAEYGLTNIYTKLGNHIWFGTNLNRIYHSADDGATWSVSAQFTSTIGTPQGVNDIAFRDANNGLALAYFGSSVATLWQTTDGGATWTNIPIAANYGLNDMCSVPGTNVYASAGAGTGNTLLSYSTNDGVSWNDWGSVGIQYLTIDFVDGANGWSGGFSDPFTASFDGMWKYTDIPLSSLAAPVAQYQMPPVSCSGSAITLTNTSTGSVTPTYTWSGAGVTFLPSQTAASPTISFASAGTYTVKLLASNSSGNDSTVQTINVVTCSAPSAAFSMSASVCGSVAVNTTNSSTGSPTPSYMWQVSPVSSVTINPSPAAVQPAFNFGIAGTYTITLTASSISGTNMATQVVTVNPLPTLSISSTNSVLCTGNTATITVTGASTYTWNSPVAVAGNTNAAVAISPTVNTTYSVTGISAAGCKSTKTFVQTVSGCVGINALTSVYEGVTIYPNPNNGNCTIKAGSSITLTVINEVGQVVKTITLNEANHNEATLDNLASGIYFVYGSNQSVVFKQKIVVTK